MSCHVWLIVWVALTLIFVGGAVDYTRDHLAQVAPGMSQTQVLRAWGEPDHVLDASYAQSRGGERIDSARGCTTLRTDPSSSKAPR